MCAAEEKLKRAAIRYGRTYAAVQSVKTLEARKKFIRAELALGWAALAFNALPPKRKQSGTSGSDKKK